MCNCIQSYGSMQNAFEPIGEIDGNSCKHAKFLGPVPGRDATRCDRARTSRRSSWPGAAMADVARRRAAFPTMCGALQLRWASSSPATRSANASSPSQPVSRCPAETSPCLSMPAALPSKDQQCWMHSSKAWATMAGWDEAKIERTAASRAALHGFSRCRHRTFTLAAYLTKVARRLDLAMPGRCSAPQARSRSRATAAK